MRTHLFSTAITTKAAVTAATVVLIGGGAALADTVDLELGDDEEGVEEPVEAEEEDDGDAYALGRDDDGQDARTEVFCETEDTDSPRCDVETSDEDELEEEALGLEEEVEVEGEGEGERSETAQRVHRALIGGDPLGEGESFGQRVSSRARSGEPGALGDLVSRSARGETVEDLDLGNERVPRGNGNADGEEPEASTSEDEEIEPAEAGGPPDHAKARGRR